MEIQRLLCQNIISATDPPVEIAKLHQIQTPHSHDSPRLVNDRLIDGLTPDAAGIPRPRLSPVDAQSVFYAGPPFNFPSAPTHCLEPLPSPGPAYLRKTTAASILQQSFTHSTSCTSTTRKALHFAARPAEKGRGNSSVCSAITPIISAPKRKCETFLDDAHFRDALYTTEPARKLKSKQASQSVAEQRRRDRMSSALQELASLLPNRYKRGCVSRNNVVQRSDSREGDTCGSEGSDGKDGAATKASIVESAIEYIKQMKKELIATNERIRVAKRKLRMRHDREESTLIRRLSFASQS